MLFALPLSVSAQVIDVDFETSPLFSSVNLLPGDTVVKEFTITNTSGTAQDTRLKAVDTVLGGLENALTISIVGGSTHYFDTLDHFYAENFVELENLADESSATYEVTVHFPSEKGNEYQGKATGFDLCVGFSGDNENCVTSTDSDTPDTTPTLTTFRTPSGSSSGGSCAPGIDCTSTGDPDDDGIPNKTDLDDDGDGIPDANDSTPFGPGTSVGEGTSEGTGDALSTRSGHGGEGVGSSESDSLTSAERDAPGDSQDKGTIDEDAGSRLGAAAFLGLPATLRGAVGCLSIFLLILLIISLLTIGLDAVRDAPSLHDRERIQGRIVIITLLVLLSIVVAIIVPIPCVIVPLSITALICFIWFALSDARLRDRDHTYLS